MSAFIPKVRFIVMSDVHVKPEKDCKELVRLKKGLLDAYKYADGCDYNKIDALVVVGDFANHGAEEEMLNFKEVLDECIRPETDVTLSLASHEYGSGEDVAKERLKRIFGMHYDAHKVINGFHFISVSSTRGCHFDEPQIEFAKKSLDEACADSYDKPIFFFQHPHLTDTVYGSIYWGEDELYTTLINYPQIIDFSGHSHAPVNDARSIHQDYFTSVGTGSLSYFELDEFDKIGGTIPKDASECAQFLIVEADENNRVRIKPFDILTGNFFPVTWKIDEPGNSQSFIYTRERYNTQIKPRFPENTVFKCDIGENSIKLTFGQAEIAEDSVNDYKIVIKNENNKTVKQLAVWSGYYLYNMPETISTEIGDLKKGKYSVTVIARGFWKNESDNSLYAEFEIK